MKPLTFLLALFISVSCHAQIVVQPSIPVTAFGIGGGLAQMEVTQNSSASTTRPVLRINQTDDNAWGLTIGNSGFCAAGVGNCGLSLWMNGAGDTGIFASSDGDTANRVVTITGSEFQLIGTTGGVVLGSATYIEGQEQTAPAAPTANGFRLFSQDNGAGKTQLCVRFNSGVAQCFATQP